VDPATSAGARPKAGGPAGPGGGGDPRLPGGGLCGARRQRVGDGGGRGKLSRFFLGRFLGQGRKRKGQSQARRGEPDQGRTSGCPCGLPGAEPASRGADDLCGGSRRRHARKAPRRGGDGDFRLHRPVIPYAAPRCPRDALGETVHATLLPRQRSAAWTSQSHERLSRDPSVALTGTARSEVGGYEQRSEGGRGGWKGLAHFDDDVSKGLIE